MREWFRKQYGDIKGNLKWAVLLGIIVALRDLGKKMLLLIPSFPNWAVWPILFLLCLVAFVWIAKAQNNSGIKSQTSLGSHQQEVKGLTNYEGMIALATRNATRLEGSLKEIADLKDQLAKCQEKNSELGKRLRKQSNREIG